MAANSVSKIDFCKRLSGKALKMLARNMRDIERGEDVYEELRKMCEVFESSEDTDLQPLFELSKAVIEKVEEHLRIKSVSAVVRQFDRLTAKVNRYASKMEGGVDLQKRMAICAADVEIINEIEDLDPFFTFFEKVWKIVGDFENEQVVHIVERMNNGWTVDREGNTARYAEPYMATNVHAEVVTWKANMPLSGANHREFQAWRQAGWDLVNKDLKFPFGVCQCGNEPLLPYQKRGGTEWLPGKLGRNCYKASTESFGSLKKVLKVETRTPEEIEADRVKAREENERNLVAKKLRRQNAAKMAKQKRDDGDELLQTYVGGRKPKGDGSKHAAKKVERAAREQGTDITKNRSKKSKKKGGKK